MKILVVYYSRHSHTATVGQAVAKLLRADREEIKDQKNRQHLVNWALGAFDEELRTPTKIEPPAKNPLDYDLVVVGTPIWDGVVPAVKAYLAQNRFKRVAFFVTFHSAAEDAAWVMAGLAKQKPVAILEIQDLQIKKLEGKTLIKNFCRELKKQP